MEIRYNNKKLERICTDYSYAVRVYGISMAEKIHMRIEDIQNAENVEIMVKWHMGRCHPLRGSRKDQYAVDLTHPFRLIFEVIGDEVQIADIMEIVDYH